MESPSDRLSAETIQSALGRHEGALVQYALRILGDLDQARDVVQDTFLRLVDRPPQNGTGEALPEERLAGWLYTTCRNRALDVRKKEGRMTTLDDATAERRTGESPPPESALEQREQVEVVMDQLTRLPAKQQEAIRLKFGHGLSYRDIAEAMGQTASNVGFLIHTGLKTLRHRTAGAGPEGAR